MSAEPLLSRFYRHATHTDVQDRATEVKEAIAESARRLSAAREPGAAAVRVFNPTLEDDGWSGRSSVVQVVTDDMPFLVDSVLGELQRREIPVRLLLHPQMRVQRADGDVTLLPNDADEGELESWIYVEVDRLPEQEQRDDLAARLEQVLTDVRHSCADWKSMREQCRNIIAELREHTPQTVDPATVQPTIDFLTWLEDNHFTFLGYREYVLEGDAGSEVLRSLPDSGLGILRHREGDDPKGTISELRPEARSSAREPRLLTITKANSRATVHRPVYLDYVGVRSFDSEGRVVAERRFLGLFTNSAYSDSVTRLPIISDKVRQIVERSGYAVDSHSGKDLMGVLENYPRDELFQADIDVLAENAGKILFLQERRATRLFVRKDEFGRFVSALVYLPKDRFNTAVRVRIEELLLSTYGAETADYTTRVGDSTLAQIHYLLRMPRGGSIPDVDVDQLQRDLVEASRSWEERLLENLEEHFADEETTGEVWARYAAGFPEAYKEDFDAATALEDLTLVRSLETRTAKGMPLRVYDPQEDDRRLRRLKLYRDSEITLTEVLPVFTHMGVKVIDERPYQITGRDGQTRHIYDFGMMVDRPEVWGGEFGDSAEVERLRRDFEDAFAAVWSRAAESDSLNSLVLTADLVWRDVVILRTVVRYLRQVGTFSLDYLEEALAANPVIARLVVRLFAARFDPDAEGDRQAETDRLHDEILQSLDEVSSLDQDRIIRSVVNVVTATLRTNFYQLDENGQPKPHVSLKLDPRAIEGLPEPRPAYEIWVYAPRVEGVHLRFGSVARGGLRWSDRREDFRTEVLGLVKAQMVKNAVIVPTGSKGGFVAKSLPDPAQDREAWLNEGIGCYRIFIKGMLDLTDNRVDGEIVPPQRVVRHDGDDSYLVVAADKGTASFSDIANAVSGDYGFWLDDAFASGGSAGYDHKEMGITARGAWESVKRHFRELGVDTQSEEFTVAGVGDMSGDVFGNGMLLSEHIRLIAAFDHRHIFLDPDPEAAASYAERQRLFDLPRSSWEEYDSALISEGGGVFPRTAKSIEISPQVRTALGLADDVTTMAPNALLSAILAAPVDLFWNGGIGTYVKASDETHAEVGDRANDAIRVNGADLRVKVVGEGGNLGLSQRGRIEAAMHGVHVNTDAIDNSGGVDSSDQEVNIKIALTPLVQSGRMTREARNELLASMTDQVAANVLRHNYEQNVLIGNARHQKGVMLSVHRRLMNYLADKVGLDRELEFLPDDAELARREDERAGLTSPEFAVLLAYAKIAIKEALLDSDLPDQEYLISSLTGYFPQPLVEAVGDGLVEHPLRREIIANDLANDMVNRGGVTFAFRCLEETGATVVQVARAFVVCREVFNMGGFVAAVEALDGTVSTEVQAELYLEFRRLMDRAVRWFLNNQALSADIPGQIDRFASTVQHLSSHMGELLKGTERDRWAEQVEQARSLGLDTEMAQWYASLLDSYSLLDIVELAGEAQVDPDEAGALYFAISEQFGVDALLTSVSELPREDRWSSLARGAARDDLYGVLRGLTRTVLLSSTEQSDPQERIEQWSGSNQEALDRVSQVLTNVAALDEPGLAAVSVALRTLRGLVRQGAAS